MRRHIPFFESIYFVTNSDTSSNNTDPSKRRCSSVGMSKFATMSKRSKPTGHSQCRRLVPPATDSHSWRKLIKASDTFGGKLLRLTLETWKEVFVSIIDLTWALRFSGLKRNTRWNPTRAFVEAIITNSPPTAQFGGLG